ncbi:MAG: hypothetical protein WB562_02820, partial [Candidatus Sulfotelmatobacter sp.]
RIGASQATNRLAQPPGGKQAITRILRRGQDNVEIAEQRAVLKTVVKQMEFRPESRFNEAPGLVSIFTHDHWNLELSSDQQRLVAEIVWRPGRIDQQNTVRPPSIAARKNIELDSARF